VGRPTTSRASTDPSPGSATQPPTPPGTTCEPWHGGLSEYWKAVVAVSRSTRAWLILGAVVVIAVLVAVLLYGGGGGPNGGGGY
jgi:hypothetical protein